MDPFIKQVTKLHAHIHTFYHPLPTTKSGDGNNLMYDEVFFLVMENLKAASSFIAYFNSIT